MTVRPQSTLKEQILNRILGQLPSGQPVSATDIANAEIPKAVKRFLVKALSRRVNQEMENIRPPRSEWIDFSATLYDDAFENLKEVLNGLGQFPSVEIEKYADRAVGIVVDYLNRPIDTLVDFLFIRDADTSTCADIKRRVDYFTIYPHLISEVLNVVANASPVGASRDSADSEISRADLYERLSKADRTAGAAFTANQWLDTLKPLCELYAYGAQLKDQFPVELPARFIEGRGSPELAQFLREKSSENGEMIDSVALGRLLQDAFRPEPAPDPVAHHQKTATSKSAGAELPLWKQYTENDPPPAAAADEHSTNRPLWKTYAVKESDPDVAVTAEPDVAVTAEPDVAATPEPDVAVTPEPDFVQNEVAELTEANTTGTLEVRVLGRAKKLRGLFINELFNGDTDAYESVINLLSRSNGWTESAEILKTEIFLKYRVDIYSESAIAFTNAVEEHIKQFN